MRIVVTGGAGFIGKHLLDLLVADRHHVMVIDDCSVGKSAHVPSQVSLRLIDLTQVSARELARMFDAFGADAVVHLAAVHFIPDCMKNPERTFAINTRGTHTLIEAVQLSTVSRVILASSLDVYAAKDRIHDEGDQLEPRNIYGLTKALSERLLEYAVRVGACESGIALRLANVYGPNETNPHVIPNALRRILRRDTPVLNMGYLGASRDFVYVKDVAGAFSAAVTQAPPDFCVLNAGTGRAVPVRTVVSMLQRLLEDKRPVHEDVTAFRKFDRVSLTPNVQAIEKILGWRASTPMIDGLKAVVANACPKAIEQTA
jgi:UDP-glucose 4-epimerase